MCSSDLAEQRIVRDLSSVKAERGDCFAMVIVSKKERAGVLVGESPPVVIAGAVQS